MPACSVGTLDLQVSLVTPVFPRPSTLWHLSSALPCHSRRRDRDPPCVAQPHRDGQWATSVAGGEWESEGPEFEFCRLLTVGNQHSAYFTGRDVPRLVRAVPSIGISFSYLYRVK